MITGREQALMGMLVDSIKEGNLAMVEVTNKITGARGVALVVHDARIEKAAGFRWIPIAIFDHTLSVKVKPTDSDDWMAHGKTMPLAGEDSQPEIEIAPNMAPARA